MFQEFVYLFISGVFFIKISGRISLKVPTIYALDENHGLSYHYVKNLHGFHLMLPHATSLSTLTPQSQYPHYFYSNYYFLSFSSPPNDHLKFHLPHRRLLRYQQRFLQKPNLSSLNALRLLSRLGCLYCEFAFLASVFLLILR
jgi:hypothetical protein